MGKKEGYKGVAKYFLFFAPFRPFFTPGVSEYFFMNHNCIIKIISIIIIIINISSNNSNIILIITIYLIIVIMIIMSYYYK
jgi:hypothetical protein